MAARVTQGKCTHCKLYYQWAGRPLLRLARCPNCRRLLARTSCYLKRFRRATAHPLEAVADPGGQV